MKKYPFAPISSLAQPENSKEPDAEEEDEEAKGDKAKRRRRNDQDGRSYKCGCGKMYLSYPALYTHIKTKHQGINPEGTNAPQFRNGRGRGRPRKLKDTTDPVKEHKLHPSDNIRKNPNFADEISFLYGIGMYSKDGTDPLKNFPQIYVGDEMVDHPLLATLKEQIEKHNSAKKGDRVSETSDKVKWVIGKFLYEHARVCNAEYYSFVMWMTCLLYKFLEEEIQDGYCSVLNSEEIPMHIGGLTSYLKDVNYEAEEEKVGLFVRHFCEWLYAHGFTHLKIDFNS